MIASDHGMCGDWITESELSAPAPLPRSTAGVPRVQGARIGHQIMQRGLSLTFPTTSTVGSTT